MQREDSSSPMYTSPMNMNPNKFPEQEHLKCPRCDSNNTKFCYYNNYNLSQPRHFCKNCRRYWTKGGTLRNIPIGGGTRKHTKRSSNSNSKRGSNSSSSSSYSYSYSSSALAVAVAVDQPPPPEQKPEASGMYGYGNDPTEASGISGGGSFSSMLGSSPGGQFAKLLMDGLSPNMIDGLSNDGLIRNPEGFESNFLNVNHVNHMNHDHKKDDQSEIEGDIGWPDLSIYTPGSSSFH